MTGEIGLHATPTVARDVVIVGGAFADAPAPRTHNNTKGLVQAFDAQTGERLWTFRTVPGPGEVGHDTWENDSWGINGNNGVWTQISVDAELGMVYLPVETPSGDYYGGHRPGDNLFGESLVAVDLETGERRWHFQLVHHPLWGFDMACAPILADITVDGREVKAVALPSKQAFLYVFDRVTGEPVWPIDERPVPQGDVPGEWYSPTQPFPTRPPAYDKQGSSLDDLIDFTPELRAEAEAVVSRYKLGPIFTPPILSQAGGPIATLGLGAGSGGTNWPGGAYDPETHIIYVPSRTAFYSWELIPPPDPDASDMRYVKGTPMYGVGHGGLRDLNVRGLPLSKPPYGRLSAIDLDRGEILWQTPHGSTPDRVRYHAALAGVEIPRTGEPCDVRILPRTSWRGQDLVGPDRVETGPNGRPVDPISIPQEEPGRRVPREGVAELLCRPRRGRMIGHVEMHDATAFVGQHDEDKQDATGEGWDDEEVDRDQLSYVIGQERSPRL